MSDFLNRKYVTIQIILTHTNNLEWTLNLNILVTAEISPKENVSGTKWAKQIVAEICLSLQNREHWALADTFVFGHCHK